MSFQQLGCAWLGDSIVRLGVGIWLRVRRGDMAWDHPKVLVTGARLGLGL